MDTVSNPWIGKTMTRLTFLAATAAIIGWAGAASAADIDQHRGSMKDAPFIAPAPTWNGIWVGIGGGGAASAHEAELTGAEFDGTPIGLPIFPLFDTGGDIGEVSGFGTVQLGFDRQRNRWVFGLFADYDWMSMDTEIVSRDIDVSGPAGPGFGSLEAGFSIEIDNMWSVGGRIGFLTSPNTMLYGLLAYTRADITAISNVTLSDGAGGTAASLTNAADLDMDGFTIGAGMESKLADNLSLKFEYRFTDLDKGNLAGTPLAVPGVLGVSATNAEIDPDIHSVRAVLVYRPDWSGRN
jgi:outer membrane immunogenic protein